MTARYFRTAADFRRWLTAHHATERELLVGFYKKAAEKPGIRYKEAVDEALCFGWIDGIKRRVDEQRYTHRFTPRKAHSTWSSINTNRVGALIALGRMAKPGLEAFGRRDPEKTERYSFERQRSRFSRALERAFRCDAIAWSFFSAQPPGYRRLMTFWVMSAKQPETRERRLATLVKRSAEGKRIQ